MYSGSGSETGRHVNTGKMLAATKHSERPVSDDLGKNKAKGGGGEANSNVFTASHYVDSW